jgi:hypothetical protein
MSKYVIYNPDDDTYLNCGPSIHNISDNDIYVEDVNDATLFNTLDEIWELLTDFEYTRTIEPVVLKVAVDVIPDHTIDHYLIKKETDEAMIEGALEGDVLNEEAKEFLKDFIASLGEKKLFSHRDIQRIQNAIDKETRCRNDPLGQRGGDIFDDEYISDRKIAEDEENRNVFNPSDSEYI